MLERFTDGARRVVVLAQEEARLLNHDYIGTEHLLLGLVQAGEEAARALESLEVTLNAVRQEVEALVGRGEHTPSSNLPFSPQAKKVLELSLRQALLLGHTYIGTEHILLGLINEDEGIAAQVMVRLGADLDRVRQRLFNLPPAPDPEREAHPGGTLHAATAETSRPRLKPDEIHERLDRYVIGQHLPKRALSAAVYNHYKRFDLESKDTGGSQIVLGKSNILMLGPTGSGKSHLVQTLADLLAVPLLIADATAYTIEGRIGKCVDNLVRHLLAAAEDDPARAETGIVYIDGVDALALTRGSQNGTGIGGQRALLGLIDGKTVHGVNTANVLFVAAGAFPGIDKVILERTQLSNRDPLTEADHAERRSLTGTAHGRARPEDLTSFGLIPELVGRFPIVLEVTALDREDLARVLTDPPNALIKQYQHLIEADGAQLRFTDEAVQAVALRAAAIGTGARGLQAVLEGVMLPILYSAPSQTNTTEFVVTADMVQASTYDG